MAYWLAIGGDALTIDVEESSIATGTSEGIGGIAVTALAIGVTHVVLGTNGCKKECGCNQLKKICHSTVY